LAAVTDGCAPTVQADVEVSQAEAVKEMLALATR